ncbi:Cupredoxin [Halomonas sp. 7T]|uniref:Cupredoxin n=1 Tax=Halomonas sp. 7T TaxID=2893469 RepID=UPI0021DAC043|nr:Cupredoxin [Halomonas sp. 7T]UXZ55387.1 Cupredoxin [Halomonas sp. 7T]
MPLTRKTMGLRHVAWPLITLAALFSVHTNAATVNVIDTDGFPLEHAVIEVYIERAASPAPAEKNIIQRDAAFHPTVTTVPTGSYVAFPNEDTTRHHVFSFSEAKPFDLELFLNETPPPIHFDQPGVVVLGCNIHDQMQAFIVVSDAPYAALTQGDGTLNLPMLPEGSHRMRVWHSRMDDSQNVWWEGEIRHQDNITVELELNAVPRQPPTLSPLQQRFQNATHSH